MAEVGAAVARRLFAEGASEPRHHHPSPSGGWSQLTPCRPGP